MLQAQHERRDPIGREPLGRRTWASVPRDY
jgi:hypothetical protein